MKKLLVIGCLLFVVGTSTSSVQAQEKPDFTKQKQEIQQQANQLQQELKSKLDPLKAQVYDAKKLIDLTEKEITRIEDEANGKLAELQKKYQAILDEEKTAGNKK